MRFRHSVLPTLLLTTALPAQGDPEVRLETVVARLAAAETLDGEAVGYAGIRSETWKTFLELRRIADAATLQALTRHRDPVVRCYAVRALVLDHGADGVAGVLLEHVTDVEPVAVMEGCIRYEQPAGRVMIREAGEHLGDKALLDVAERHRALGKPLSGLVLTDTRSREPEALRRRVAAGDRSALVALAAHGLERDVPAIDAALRKGGSLGDVTAALQAAAAHGSAELLPALRAMTPWVLEGLASERCYEVRHWLAALAVQDDQPVAKAVLRELAAELGDGPRKRLWSSLAAVVRLHPDSALTELLPE